MTVGVTVTADSQGRVTGTFMAISLACSGWHCLAVTVTVTGPGTSDLNMAELRVRVNRDDIGPAAGPGTRLTVASDGADYIAIRN